MASQDHSRPGYARSSWSQTLQAEKCFKHKSSMLACFTLPASITLAFGLPRQAVNHSDCVPVSSAQKHIKRSQFPSIAASRLRLTPPTSATRVARASPFPGEIRAQGGARASACSGTLFLAGAVPGDSVEHITAVAWRPLQLDRGWFHDLRPKAARSGSDGLWSVPARCSVFLFERTAAFPGRIGIRGHSLFRQALRPPMPFASPPARHRIAVVAAVVGSIASVVAIWSLVGDGLLQTTSCSPRAPPGPPANFDGNPRAQAALGISGRELEFLRAGGRPFPSRGAGVHIHSGERETCCGTS